MLRYVHINKNEQKLEVVFPKEIDYVDQEKAFHYIVEENDIFEKFMFEFPNTKKNFSPIDLNVYKNYDKYHYVIYNPKYVELVDTTKYFMVTFYM